jgi:hypothetical protein
MKSQRVSKAGVALSVAVLLAMAWGGWEFARRWNGRWTGGGILHGHRATWHHYGDDVIREAADRGLSAAYLLALIELESGGRKPAGRRYEKHIHRRLVAVQNGKRERLEQVTTASLAGASEEALMNLATSWGPFQLMGYKCIGLDVQIRDLRGDSAIPVGVRWIDETYGDVLRAGRYRDAFHIHNAGQPFPADGVAKTFHPNYVERGLALMKRYERELEAQQNAP